MKILKKIGCLANTNMICMALVFSFYTLKSQNIVCTYHIKVDSVFLVQNNIDTREIFYNYITYVDELSYKLKINNQESWYEIDGQKLQNVPERFRGILASVGGKGVFYHHSKDSISLRQQTLLGDTYLIRQDLPQWTYTNESKVIDGIQCLKAYTIETITFGNRESKRYIYAWFAPSLPYAFGPKNYCGLPGLVMELQENEKVFYLDKIIFTDDDVSLPVPHKGIKMTEKEFERYLSNNLEDLFKNNINKN